MRLQITTLHALLRITTLVHIFMLYRASPEAYGALEQSPLNRGSTPSLESSNKVHPLFDT